MNTKEPRITGVSEISKIGNKAQNNTMRTMDYSDDEDYETILKKYLPEDQQHS